LPVVGTQKQSIERAVESIIWLIMPHVTASDGAQLAYEVHCDVAHEQSITIMLLHGWSGSGNYFCLNIPGLKAKGMKVIVPHLRFHGESDKPSHGFHVARLAADVHDLLQQLELQNVVMVGTSMVRAYQEHRSRLQVNLASCLRSQQ
jgi:pimeloyl-ACP methyl ester carboxylesterase